MPCNPETVNYWPKKGAPGKVVTLDGRVVSCEFEGDHRVMPGIGYISHFATCPNPPKARHK